jgi:hypothetical protein
MRSPTPSERRLDELCALRRPLTEYEIDEVRDLKVAIRKAREFRRRYANDNAFREREKARKLQYWQERRA